MACAASPQSNSPTVVPQEECNSSVRRSYFCTYSVWVLFSDSLGSVFPAFFLGRRAPPTLRAGSGFRIRCKAAGSYVPGFFSIGSSSGLLLIVSTASLSDIF